jgi:drug/metabolite transporter (DMT)-like permease
MQEILSIYIGKNMGYFFALFTVFLWAGNIIIARMFAESIPPVGMSFWRWVVAFAVCFPFTYKDFLRDLPIVGRHWKYLTTLSLFGTVLFNTFLYLAGQTTTAFNMSVIATMAPVMMVMMSVFFMGERLGFKGWIGFCAAAFGVLSLISEWSVEKIANFQFLKGDLYMLAGVTVFASYSVLIRRKPEGMKMNSLIFYTFGSGVIMLAIPYLLETRYIAPVVFGKSQVLAILYVGVIASFVCYMMWNRAIMMIGAARVGLIYYLIPVFTGFMGYIMLGETVTVTDIVSMGLVASGIILSRY